MNLLRQLFIVVILMLADTIYCQDAKEIPQDENCIDYNELLSKAAHNGNIEDAQTALDNQASKSYYYL